MTNTAATKIIARLMGRKPVQPTTQNASNAERAARWDAARLASVTTQTVFPTQTAGQKTATDALWDI
jgi:hypothetical protein